jgi:hypothetical protein
MIIPVEDLTAMPEFSGKSEKELQKKLSAVEQLIRSYSNNNFQNRCVRFQAGSLDDMVFGTSQFLKVGDTVQISQSMVNDGLYVITEIASAFIRLDAELFEVPMNLVTKVEYPEDVKNGVVELMIWEAKNRQKVGIKSETLSRHSVTYYDQDAGNQVMGYPVALLGFLQPYIKPRF